MSRKNIYINASEIATIINKNPYDVLSGFNRIINKFAKENIIQIKETLQVDNERIKQEIIEIQKLPQNTETIKREKVLVKKQTVLNNNIENIQKSTTTDQQKVEKIIPNYVPDMTFTPAVQKQELRKEIEKKGIKVEEKLVENFINKSYGTKTEDSAIEMYQKKFKVKLDISQKFYSYPIKGNYNFDYFIGGKMDGIYKEEYIVEIKNRMRGFFPALKDYEKCQIYTYMLMTGIKSVKLVERFNDKIKTTNVSLEESYKNEILGALDIFVKSLDTFLQSDSINDFLIMNDTQKIKLIHQLYLNDINEFYNGNVSEDCDSTECIFE